MSCCDCNSGQLSDIEDRLARVEQRFAPLRSEDTPYRVARRTGAQIYKAVVAEGRVIKTSDLQKIIDDIIQSNAGTG